MFFRWKERVMERIDQSEWRTREHKAARELTELHQEALLSSNEEPFSGFFGLQALDSKKTAGYHLEIRMT